ncbi:MAG: hypothetical protein ACI8WB_000079 [Phenylobacterium sp.]|jgi:hypothetical protein
MIKRLQTSKLDSLTIMASLCATTLMMRRRHHIKDKTGLAGRNE